MAVLRAHKLNRPWTNAREHIRAIEGLCYRPSPMASEWLLASIRPPLSLAKSQTVPGEGKVRLLLVTEDVSFIVSEQGANSLISISANLSPLSVKI